MSFVTDITDGLLALRADAESIMISTCTIARATGVTVDPETGKSVSTGDTIYVGVCRVRFTGVGPRDVDASGQLLVAQSPVLSIPVDADGSANVLVDDVATITGNPLDVSMVGLKFRVTGMHSQTYATARRFPVTVVS